MKVKEGDVITMTVKSTTEIGSGNRYLLVPEKLKVLGVYKNHVLCQYIKSGIRECFTWADIKENMIRVNT